MKQVFEIKDKKIIQNVFDRTEYGTLALCDEGIPYSVPVNFVAIDGLIYFHGAQKGRKMNIIFKNIINAFFMMLLIGNHDAV